MTKSNDRANAWISIPAAVYEGHMKSPRVLQQQFLSDVFREVIGRHRPGSVAVVGCATGNGFEHIDPRVTRTVVGIDVNPEYLAILVERYGESLAGLRVVLADIAACDIEACSLDVVHCALVLEYVDPHVVVAKTAAWLRPGGVMSVVLQLPSAGQAKVSETEFKDVLSRLEPVMHLVDPGDFTRLATGAGFQLKSSEVRTLETGKGFFVAEYVRERPRQTLARGGK